MDTLKKVLPITLLIVIICLAFTPYILGNVGITPHVGTNDLTDTQIPFRHALQQSLQSNQLPLWDPRISAGFPLFAEGQIASLHPLNLLFALLPVSAYLSVSLNIVATIIISSLGMYLYIHNHFKEKIIGKPLKAIALFAALVWGLNGFHLNHVAHLNNLNVLSMLPWQLLVIDSIFKANSIKEKLLAARWYALPVALQILSGHPQFTAYSLMYNALYCLGLLILSRLNVKQIILNSLLIMLFLLWGLGIGAVQLLPTLEFSQNSTRQSGLTEESANFLSFRIKDLQTLITPFYEFNHEPRSLATLAQIGWPFDERYSYIGIIPLILSLLAIPFLIKDRSILIHAVLGLFFLLLAMGNQTPLGTLLRIPPLNMFRLPAKFTVFFQFAGAILAAYTIYSVSVQLSKKTQSISKFLPVTIAILTVVTLIDVTPKLYKLYPIQKGEWWYEKPQLVQSYEKQNVNSPDKYYYDRVIGQNYNVQLQKQYLYQDPELWNNKQAQMFKNNRELLPAFNMLTYDVPLLTNAINSAGLKVKWYSEIENVLFFSPLRENNSLDPRYWKLAKLAGAKYLIHDETINDNNAELITKTNFSTGQDQIGLYKLTDALPFIQIPEQVIYAADADTYQAINKPEFNPATTIVLPDSAPKFTNAIVPASISQIRYKSMSHLQIDLQTDSANTPLFIRQSYYPGWTAYIDNQATPIYRASHAFQTIIINSPGSHTIDVKYEPQSLKTGLYLSVVSLITYLILVAGLTVHSKRVSSRLSSQPKIEKPLKLNTEA